MKRTDNFADLGVFYRRLIMDGPAVRLFGNTPMERNLRLGGSAGGGSIDAWMGRFVSMLSIYGAVPPI